MSGDLVKSKSQIRSIVVSGIYRWMNHIDLRSYSPTYGIADREYWAWKTKDFPNGTHQAGIFSLLECRELFPQISDNEIKKITSAVVAGTKKIQRKDGSFEEAFPFESSWAVTGLVAFNLIYSLIKYKSYFNESSYNEGVLVCEKCVQFLQSKTEKHGSIANHRASSVLAVYLYNYLVNQPVDERVVDPLLDLFNEEGWFVEYSGPDPGYQSLLNHYMYCALSVVNNKKIQNIHSKSVGFLKHFAFPDGSFSGELGCRGTSVTYPSGLLSNGDIENDLICWFIHRALKREDLISPVTIDEGNFVPNLNSWSFFWSSGIGNINEETQPFQYKSGHYRFDFDNSHLLGFSSENSIFIVNKKMATSKLFKKVDSQWVSESYLGLFDGKFHTQGMGCRFESESQGKYTMKYNLTPFAPKLNSPSQAIVLRFLSLLFSGSKFLNESFKSILAKYIMKTKKGSPIENSFLSVDLSGEHYEVRPVVQEPWRVIKKGYLNHMASANYYSSDFLGSDLG